MNASFVLDASVALAWLFPDEGTAATARLMERMERESVIVPGLWYLEIVNVLALAERKRRITASQSDAFLSDLERFDISAAADFPARAHSHLLPLCRAHHLSSYDATYLELAARRNLPLATLDDPLRKAAAKIGVELLGR